MGLVIDFGLLAAIAAWAWFILAERRRFERECGRLLGKIRHQYERMDNHHRYITVLQDGMSEAKGVAEKVKAIEERGAVTTEALYHHLKEVLRTGPGVYIRLDDANRKIEIVPRKPSITDVDVKTPDPSAAGVPSCTAGDPPAPPPTAPRTHLTKYPYPKETE